MAPVVLAETVLTMVPTLSMGMPKVVLAALVALVALVAALLHPWLA